MRLTTLLTAVLLLSTPTQAEPMRKSVLTTNNGVTIESYIEGEGPPIVMLPSTGRDGAEDFDEVAHLLAQAGHKVIRPQPRGIAGSTGPMQGISLHQLADDVAMVIDAEAHGRAVIIGHAFGHFVARMTAVDHPAQVRGIVLAAAAAAQYPPEIAATPSRAGNLASPDADRLAALRLGFFAPGHDPTPWLQGWFPKTLEMQINSREKAGVKQSDWWSAGTAPLLELIPANDPFKPHDRWDEMKTAYGTRVKTVIVPDASHALFPEQPGPIAQAILTWLQTLPP